MYWQACTSKDDGRPIEFAPPPPQHPAELPQTLTSTSPSPPRPRPRRSVTAQSSTPTMLPLNRAIPQAEDTPAAATTENAPSPMEIPPPSPPIDPALLSTPSRSTATSGQQPEEAGSPAPEPEKSMQAPNNPDAAVDELNKNYAALHRSQPRATSPDDIL